MKMNKKLFREIMVYGYTIFIFCLYTMPIYAKGKDAEVVNAEGTIKDSQLVIGGKALLNDVLSAVQIIVPLLAGVVCVIAGSHLSSAEDEQEAKVAKKKIKTAVIGGMIGLLGASLAKIVLGYFTVAAK